MVLKQQPFYYISQFHGLTRVQLGSSSNSLTWGLSWDCSLLWLWLGCVVPCGFFWHDASVFRAFSHDLSLLDSVHGSSDLQNERNRSFKAFLVTGRGSPRLSLPLHFICQRSHRPDSRGIDLSSTSWLEEGHMRGGIVWDYLWRLIMIMAFVHLTLPSFSFFYTK